jgi:hypothetical protein
MEKEGANLLAALDLGGKVISSVIIVFFTLLILAVCQEAFFVAI